jgi:hypothetical protein
MTRVVINRITGAYWPAASGPREPSLNQYGELIPRDDEHLVHVVEGLWEAPDGHAAELCEPQGDDLAECQRERSVLPNALEALLDGAFEAKKW